MAKYKEHQEALRLRKFGKSYAEIREILGVSKGTLSMWLKDYPLSPTRIRALRDWNAKRIEHYRETRKKKREAALRVVYKAETTIIGRLSERDIFITGLFLYWGEGAKTKMTEVSLANTNPAIAKAFIDWLERSFGIKRNQVRIRLHLYKDMNIHAETMFWSRILHVSPDCFKKPYIKRSRLSDLSYKSGFGHGTCNALLSNAMVAKRVLMGLRVLEDIYLGQYFNGKKGALIKH